MAARKRTHKDVEFHVENPGYTGTTYFNDPQKALAAAAEQAMHSGNSTLDVIVHSKSGARHYGGDDAVETYNEDPDASVFDRFEFTANNVGRVR